MQTSSRIFSYDKQFRQGQVRLPCADILQVAELSIVQDAEIPLHIQHCDELTYAVSGRATFVSGDRSFVLSPKQIHYIKKGERHIITADKDSNFHFICIGFLPNPQFDGFAEFYRLIENVPDFVLPDENNLYHLFNDMIREFYQDQSDSALMIHCIFSQIIISLERMLKTPSFDFSKAVTSESNRAVYKTMKYIEQNYVTLERVTEIAQVLNYSEFYLSHVFREKTGISIKSYVMQKKIIMSVELLKNSNMSISEIADHLHFASLHAFDTAFKQYTGVSPREMKQRMLRETADPGSESL